MKIGRNDPCHCGSEKKYKKCCYDEDIMDYKTLYLKQISLLNRQTSDNDKLIIELGNKILNSSKVHMFSTGACVNASRASMNLYYQTKIDDYITAAKEYCEKALAYKSNNQHALLVLYEIYIISNDFILACDTLSLLGSEMLEEGQKQILMLYQSAIKRANTMEHTPEIKSELCLLTDKLLEIYKGNPVLPALYGAATMFYLGIGDDVIRAYEMGKRCVEEWPNAETYCTLGLICISPQLNRAKESIEYLKKGLDICDNAEVEYGLKSNLFASLVRDKNWEEAAKLGKDIIKDKPSNMNYHNYAELLKQEGDYDEAIKWCKRALFLVVDDCTLLTLADIYKRAELYSKAIETYVFCLASQNGNNNCMSFIDENGKNLFSLASNSAINSIKLEAIKGLIFSYVQIQEYENATAYVEIGKELFIEESELGVWGDMIPKIANFSQEYDNVKLALEEAKIIYEKQNMYFKEWAAKLIQLQDNTIDVDLDNVSDWLEFETQMDLILEEMKASIINHTTIYAEMSTQVATQYPHIDAGSKEFLVTANILYDVHKNSFIDFAPIIVEYAKVVEKRLRILLGSRLNPNIRMLGQVINEIANQPIPPYDSYLAYFWAVNSLRKNGAHAGVLTKSDADNMRNILFNNGLINRLV